MSHLERCVDNVKAQARSLAANLKNDWTAEGLLRSYVEQPAYDPERRAQLVEIGLAEFNLHRKLSGEKR